MKKIFNHLSMYLLLILITGLTACEQEQTEGIGAEGNLPLKEITSDNKTSVSAETAEYVATQFMQNNKNLKSTTCTIKDISILRDNTGEPSMYVINYENNGGFVIVSASKNFYPVLAYSDEGNFSTNNSDMPLGLTEWIIDNKIAIQDQSEQSIDSISKFRNLWSMYEKHSDTDIKTIKSYDQSEFSATVAQLEAEWMSGGIEYSPFHPNYPDEVSPKMYDMLMLMEEEARMTSTPFRAYILPKYEYIRSNVEELLTTTWNQDSPYNKFIKNNYPTGCVATAMVQVMRYHRWPKDSFKWDLMLDSYKSANGNIIGTTAQQDAVADLMKIGGQSILTDYGKDGSGAYTSNVPGALKNIFNYSSNVKHKNFDGSANSAVEIMNNLKNGRPVILDGKRDRALGFISYNGHAWVCDGFRYTCLKRNLTVVTISAMYGYVEVRYTPDTDGSTATETNYFHMNWGWGGSNNGWFNINSIGLTTSNGDYRNYQYDRNMVVNIYPNK